MVNQPKFKELALLPHIGLKEHIEFREFLVIGSKDIEKYCYKNLASKLKEFLKLYRDINGYYINNVGIILRKNNKRKILDPLTENDRKVVKDIANIVAFCVLNKSSLFRFTQDNFYLTFYRINPGAQSDSITLNTRSFWDHMEKKDYMFQIPEYVHYRILEDQHIDESLLRALGQCLDKENLDDTRILRAIDWYNQSQTDSPNISEYNRFILLAFAFETLLNIPSENIVRYFRNTIQMILGSDKNIDKWANDFYTKRSAIVHGQELPDLLYGSHKHNSHLELAKMIFFQVLIRKLDLMNRFFPDRQYVFVHGENVIKYLVSQKERFNEILKFKLNIKEGNPQRAKERESFMNHLWTIERKPDDSIDKSDCSNVIDHLISTGLKGIKYLKRQSRFIAQVYKDILNKYEQEFMLLQQNPQDENRRFGFTGVYSFAPGENEFPDIVVKESEIRAASIDKYVLLRLDSIVGAINDIIELRMYIRP